MRRDNLGSLVPSGKCGANSAKGRPSGKYLTERSTWHIKTRTHIWIHDSGNSVTWRITTPTPTGTAHDDEDFMQLCKETGGYPLPAHITP